MVIPKRSEIARLTAQIRTTQRALVRLKPGDVERPLLIGTLASLERHLARRLKAGRSR